MSTSWYIEGWNCIYIEYEPGKSIQAQTPSCVSWICAYCFSYNWQTDAICFHCNKERTELKVIS